MAQDVAVQAWRAPTILRMDFQPIVDTARGTVVGYESLARFGGPADAGPDCWFALAHAAGVGAELEAQVLARALEARSALPPNCFLSVNVGPQALLSTPVADVFADAGDLRGVVVEITEQTAVDNYDAFPTRSRRYGRRARCSRSTTPGPGSPRSSTSRCCARIS